MVVRGVGSVFMNEVSLLAGRIIGHIQPQMDGSFALEVLFFNLIISSPYSVGQSQKPHTLHPTEVLRSKETTPPP